MPTVDVGNTSSGLSGPGALVRDGDATPIFRQEPKFPTKAARDGIEGWVQLRFDINELGNVENVSVIDAKPKRIFDREAKKALKKWRYNPKVVDGKAIKQIGLTVQLDFKLGG
jgi:protein TonB